MFGFDFKCYETLENANLFIITNKTNGHSCKVMTEFSDKQSR